MPHRSKKSTSLIDLVKSKPKPKHTRLKKGLIGLSVGTALVAAFTKKKGNP